MTIKEAKNLAGRWIMVRFNDVGCREGVVVECNVQSKTEFDINVYFPSENGVCWIDDLDQIIEVGNYLTVKYNGL